jgi:Asp-tRNA(Asn)/Glu-tRNA(Gln) amidotransferase A subunit family amidase
MNLHEYAAHDGLGLAALVAKKEITPTELARTAFEAITALNPEVNAVVETYPDRIESFDERALGNGPFRGVPFLIKDVFGHEAGRKIEFGSRLCRGMIAQQDTCVAQLFRAAGLNIIGRTAAPEYSMSGTTEGALYGNTSTPWCRLRWRVVGRLHAAVVTAWCRSRTARTSVARSASRRATAAAWVEAVARADLGRTPAGRERLRPRTEFRPDQERPRRGGDARLPRDSASRRSVPDPEARRAVYRARAP